MNPTLRTAQDFRNEATALVNRAVRESSFNREREAQFDALMRLHDVARDSVDIRPTHLGLRHTAEDIAERARRRHEELRRDPAAMHFFSGAKVFNPLVSQQGTRLSREAFRQNGRALGEVIQMQNFGVDLEGRSYVALDTSTSGDAGGYSAPIMFWAEVIHQMKQYDQLFDACRWITTGSSNLMDIPMADDTSNVAAKVVENASVVEGPNPTFSQLQFGVCPLWSTGRILASLQLTQDSPVLFDYLTAEFARRFARGMGASFVATLLAGVDSFSAASASALVPDDLLGLMGAVDAAYAMRGGWLMNWSTWLSVKKLKTSDHYFATEVTGVDGSGHYTLQQRPVFICPSLDNLAAGKKPILYGDLQRFVARSVNATQMVNKYIEAFMANHQLGFEGIWRVDSALAKASAADVPIKALYMPLS